ncbi:hypothetical protein AEAC466_00945 [Asticcacaulis sp. AC466]|uniref:hypothetical protein n=1 Tax=Asticcacaulis sp. AC466 TaxID=1282362 RepID=UPI0003C3C145|nr:hypothetical protein [Asticcacaulis sp. AC466]ESQ85772.1 hypothetical protein AEAC466_00945 [Asticcacaulis sp. AC466]
MDIRPPVSISPVATKDLTPREQARQAEAAAKLQTARDVIKVMAKSRTDQRAQANAMARQKVEMLKQRLKMLQMSSVGNPAGVARQVAQIAKELAAAVKSYVAAGGSAADVGIATPQNTEAPSGDVAQKADAAAQAAPPDAEKASDDPSSDPKAAGDKTGEAKNPYDKAIDALNTQAAKSGKAAAEKQEDADFLTGVKALKQKLKELLAHAKAGLGQSNDTDEADTAMKALEKELANLENGAGAQALSAGGLVSVVA